MTSRERLTAVLSGGLPDRVPVSTYELCGYNSRSFENQEESYHQLMDFIRANTDSITMWDPPGSERQVKSAFAAPTDQERWEEAGTMLPAPPCIRPAAICGRFPNTAILSGPSGRWSTFARTWTMWMR